MQSIVGADSPTIAEPATRHCARRACSLEQ